MSLNNFFLSLILFSSFAQAMDRCTPNFVTAEEKVNHLEGWITNKPQAQNTIIYNKYKALKQAHPEAFEVLPANDVYDVLLDEEMLVTAKNLEHVLENFEQSLRTNHHLTPAQHLRAALKKNLTGKVPEHTINERLDNFLDGGPIFRALGEKSLDETTEMFHGGNPLAPTPDSILGQFIAKHQAQTLRRAFPHGPATVYNTFGPDKLVVAVDQSMMADFTKMISDPHMFGHIHTPNQGTLFVIHEDFQYSYMGKNNQPLSLRAETSPPALETIIPTIFLSSTESQRMSQYMKALGQQNLKAIAQRPWTLNGYCATGGYSSCTHWIGNIPIGDEVVASYTVPGKVDQYADNTILPDTEADKLPRTQDLQNYQLPENLIPEDQELVKRIWKVPGNKQLAYTLGIGKAQEFGQLANPGWVAHILTSRVKVNRSPVVFVIVPDAKVPLAPDFNLQIGAY